MLRTRLLVGTVLVLLVAALLTLDGGQESVELIELPQ